MTSRTGLQSQFLERSTFFLKVFERIFFEHAVRLKEAVYLDSGESEHFAELWFGDASSPEFFQRERFEGAAGPLSQPRC
jgi:hypothetical protein